MMKSFILAATSIAYTLSFSCIVGAKVAKINKNVSQGQSCNDPVNSTSQYNQLTKNNVSLNKDMRVICNLINEKYKKYNKSHSMNDDINSVINSQASFFFIRALEVTSIIVDSYQEYSQSKISSLSANVNLIRRDYLWQRGKNKDKWVLTSSTPLINNLVFGLRDGEWRILNDDIRDPTGRNPEL